MELKKSKLFKAVYWLSGVERIPEVLFYFIFFKTTCKCLHLFPLMWNSVGMEVTCLLCNTFLSCLLPQKALSYNRPNLVQFRQDFCHTFILCNSVEMWKVQSWEVLFRSCLFWDSEVKILCLYFLTLLLSGSFSTLYFLQTYVFDMSVMCDKGCNILLLIRVFPPASHKSLYC